MKYDSWGLKYLDPVHEDQGCTRLAVHMETVNLLISTKGQKMVVAKVIVKSRDGRGSITLGLQLSLANNHSKWGILPVVVCKSNFSHL